MENTKYTLFYEKLSEDAKEPIYNYSTDSGFDLHTTENIQLLPLTRYLAPTGLKFNIPQGCEMQIRTKSGLALNLGLVVLNSPGTIDNGYTGEIKVILYNSSQSLIKIEKGQKIAQACICPIISGNSIEIKQSNALEEKERASNGFGSTGF